MAKHSVVVISDDIDGSDGAESHKFYDVHGVQYEIDLAPANAKRLAKALGDAQTLLAPFVDNAVKVSKATARPAQAVRGRGAKVDKDQNRAIRDWAVRKGLDVAPRGRIRSDIVEQYHREAGR